MRVVSFTDQGPVRARNEDSISIDRKRQIYVVADGMGGGIDGDRVSAYAATAFADAYQDSLREHSKAEAIRSALTHINTELFERYTGRGNTAGTTLSAVVIDDGRAYFGHIGDSEIHHFRKGEGSIQTITEQHTLERDLIGKGTPRPLALAFRHVLTRSIGTSAVVDAQVGEIELLQGDILLIASDGLTNTLDRLHELEILSRDVPVDQKANLLEQTVRERKPNDNFSCVLIEIDL